MPIRFVDKTGVVVGRWSSTLGSHTAAFTGTFNVASARTGTIASQMTNAVAAFTGAFQPAARTGTIASTLGQFVAAFRSIEDPDWAAVVNQSLVVGVPFNLSLDSICTDDNSQPITYTITSGTLPAGLSQSGSRGETISGTPTTAGSVDVTFRASDVQSDDAEWATRKAALGSALLLSEDFPLTTYPTRAAWMAHLLAIRDTTNSIVVQYPFTGASAGDADAYDDPVPSGTEEKLGLDSSVYVTGGQSAYLRFRDSESPSDNGPTFGIAISNPKSRMYFQIHALVDASVLGNSYGGSHRKILFLNQLTFESGQIVAVLYLDREPWPLAYRITGTTRQLRIRHTNIPAGYGPDTFQLLGGYDSNPGAAVPTSGSAFNQRFGPNHDFPQASNSDYALVPRFQAGVWGVLTYYIDQDWSGSVSRGMYKCWFAPRFTAPQLIGMNYRDCAFQSFASVPCRSIRPVFRPENATVFPAGDHGIHFDQILVSDGSAGMAPPTYPGGFALPFPGQQIPPGQPLGAEDD